MMMMLLALMVLIPGALRLYTPQQSAAVETSALDRSAYANMDGHYRKTQEQEGRDSEPNRPLEHRPKERVRMPTEIDKAVGTGVADPLGKTTSGWEMITEAVGTMTSADSEQAVLAERPKRKR